MLLFVKLNLYTSLSKLFFYIHFEVSTLNLFLLQIKRAVAYDNFKKHISRWTAVVEKNRSADQLRFPLRNNEVEVFDNRMVDFTKSFSQPSNLQKNITALLQSSEIVQQKQKDLVII